MTVHSRARAAQTPSWFERLPSPLIGQSPAKANPYWSHHSLSSPGRLEGTLQCWLVALNSKKKGVGVQILGNTGGWKSNKATGPKRAPVEARMSSTKEPTALFACSKCFTRHPFEELSQGQQLCKVIPRKISKSCLFCFGDFSRAEKYADPVYKSSCVALTVKMGRLCNSANRIAETVGFFKSTNSLLKRFNEFLAF